MARTELLEAAAPSLVSSTEADCIEADRTRLVGQAAAALQALAQAAAAEEAAGQEHGAAVQNEPAAAAVAAASASVEGGAAHGDATPFTWEAAEETWEEEAEPEGTEVDETATHPAESFGGGGKRRLLRRNNGIKADAVAAEVERLVRLIGQAIKTQLYNTERIPPTTFRRLVPAEASSSPQEHLRLGNATFHFSPADKWESLPDGCKGAQARTDSHENIARAALRMERVPYPRKLWLAEEPRDGGSHLLGDPRHLAELLLSGRITFFAQLPESKSYFEQRGESRGALSQTQDLVTHRADGTQCPGVLRGTVHLGAPDEDAVRFEVVPLEREGELLTAAQVAAAADAMSATRRRARKRQRVDPPLPPGAFGPERDLPHDVARLLGPRTRLLGRETVLTMARAMLLHASGTVRRIYKGGWGAQSENVRAVALYLAHTHLHAHRPDLVAVGLPPPLELRAYGLAVGMPDENSATTRRVQWAIEKAAAVGVRDGAEEGSFI